MRMLGMRGQNIMDRPLGLAAQKMSARPFIPSDCAEVTYWFDGDDRGQRIMNNPASLVVANIRAKAGSRAPLIGSGNRLLSGVNGPLHTLANRAFGNVGTFEADDNFSQYYSGQAFDAGFNLAREELFMTSCGTYGAGSGTGVAGHGAFTGLSVGLHGPGHSFPERPCIYVGGNNYFTAAAGLPTGIGGDVPYILTGVVGRGRMARMWLNGVPLPAYFENNPTHADPAPTNVYVGSGDGGNARKATISDVVGGINVSEKDRHRIEGFMAWKAGLAHILTPSHPYSRRRPT